MIYGIYQHQESKKRIILIGAPGSGKGTQAQFLSKKYCIPTISTGNILRSYANLDNEVDVIDIANCMSRGTLVNDEIVINLVIKRLSDKDCCHGFLLDGFPRTLSQAKALKQAKINLDFIVELVVPDEILVERILGRRIHLSSGRIYHTKFYPPKIDGKDDITGDNLYHRLDDHENIIRKRLKEYHKQMIPLIYFYKKEAQMGRIHYLKIDASDESSVVNIGLTNLLLI
ncbi:MAG: nucleoside monophosphate kinase [Candidatus Dasytiphilus stammeri]